MTVQLPTSGKVTQARLLKTLPPKEEGKPPASIWKVRVAVGDQFVDAELFGGDLPANGTEVSVEDSNFGPKAKRKKAGGWGGGGRRGDDPETRSSIEGQVAAKLLADLVIADKATESQRAALDGWIAERVS